MVVRRGLEGLLSFYQSHGDSANQMETTPKVYPLTSLQIGDIQSYLSRALLYFAPMSHKLFVLVDNRPWLMNKHSKSTQIWQLMVTKYRMSPFTNTRTLISLPNSGSQSTKNGCFESTWYKPEMLQRWFSLIDAAKWQKRSLFPVMDLSKSLHGFIVFEVAWKDVRGINYINTLQTDTSIALEVKSLKKWDFDGINQALNSMSSWFSGTTFESLSLQYNLKQLSDMDPPAEHPLEFSVASREVSHDTPQAEAFPEDVFFDVQELPRKIDNDNDDMSLCNEENSMKKKKFTEGCCSIHEASDCETVSLLGCSKQGTVVRPTEVEECSTASTPYMDTLLLFKFSDRDLPFKLKQIIMSDLRLLTLLESGLPAWVIFLQSYPIFCQCYRPWMRPLARTLYILISLVTVIIGFYDLYKNVPVLKATVASLFGPVFDWIEAWETISRIRYLGTMLFLHNFQKALKWCLMMKHVIKPVVRMLTQPLVGPFVEVLEFISPAWDILLETGRIYFSIAWVVIGSSYSTVVELVDVLLSPFEFLYSYVWTAASSIYPILCSIWELFLAPIRLVLALGNYVASLASDIYVLLENVWKSASNITQRRYLSEVKPGGHGFSIWQALWKDLFSQVFRAIGSIIRGFTVFFASCNRHRLSIYNHMRVFIHQFYVILHLAPYPCQCQQTLRMEQHHMICSKECDRCK